MSNSKTYNGFCVPNGRQNKWSLSQLETTYLLFIIFGFVGHYKKDFFHSFVTFYTTLIVPTWFKVRVGFSHDKELKNMSSKHCGKCSSNWPMFRCVCYLGKAFPFSWCFRKVSVYWGSSTLTSSQSSTCCSVQLYTENTHTVTKYLLCVLWSTSSFFFCWYILCRFSKNKLFSRVCSFFYIITDELSWNMKWIQK